LAYLKQGKEEQRFHPKDRELRGEEEEAKQQKKQRQKSQLLNLQEEPQEVEKNQQQKKALPVNLQPNLPAENQHLSLVRRVWGYQLPVCN
jgi:hypothetical protein